MNRIKLSFVSGQKHKLEQFVLTALSCFLVMSLFREQWGWGGTITPDWNPSPLQANMYIFTPRDTPIQLLICFLKCKETGKRRTNKDIVKACKTQTVKRKVLNQGSLNCEAVTLHIVSTPYVIHWRYNCFFQMKNMYSSVPLLSRYYTSFNVRAFRYEIL